MKDVIVNAIMSTIALFVVCVMFLGISDKVTWIILVLSSLGNSVMVLSAKVAIIREQIISHERIERMVSFKMHDKCKLSEAKDGTFIYDNGIGVKHNKRAWSIYNGKNIDQNTSVYPITFTGRNK